MGKGKVRENDVFFRCFHHIPRLTHVRHDVAVREHHTLGAPGGARRINDGREIRGRRRRREFRDVVPRSKPLFKSPVGNMVKRRPGVGVVCEDHALKMLQIVAGVREAVPTGKAHGHEKFRFRVIQNIAGTSRGVACVQRYRHQSVCERRLIEGEGVDRTRQEHRHLVAFFKPHAGKSFAPAQNPFGKFTPGDGNPAVGGVVVPAIGLAFGPNTGGADKEFRQDGDFFRKARQG